MRCCVAFCTHARNLLEFFFRDPDTNYYAAAMDYANPNYEKLDLEENPKCEDAVQTAVCPNQSYADNKKILPPQRKDLIDIIYEQATRLGEIEVRLRQAAPSRGSTSRCGGCKD